MDSPTRNMGFNDLTRVHDLIEKTPPKKEAAVGENLCPTAPLFLGRFLCYLEC